MSIEFRGFAVFDVETTGLFPERHDRIIEIGIVRLDEHLEVIERWETLIDPERDIGSTKIHGITASDVKGAPRFEEVIGDIWHRFECAVPVAHNLIFDRKFILAELARSGVNLSDFKGICTLQLASGVALSKGSRTLVQLCETLGICTSNAHSAGHDAWMCAEVLRHLSKHIDLSEWKTPVSVPELWCRAATPLGLTRQLARSRPIESRLQEAAKRVCGATIGGPVSSETIDAYLSILDRVLEDRVVDQNEVQELLRFATECGMPAESLDGVHRNYVQALVTHVLKDGAVSDAERRDLARVTGLLGIENEFIDSCLVNSAARFELPREDLAGKSVCFTGELRCKLHGKSIDRTQAEKLARDAGMVPKSNVTKSLDILVVADPDSCSGKAKKAREYSIRIMTEFALWQKLGVDVE